MKRILTLLIMIVMLIFTTGCSDLIKDVTYLTQENAFLEATKNFAKINNYQSIVSMRIGTNERTTYFQINTKLKIESKIKSETFITYGISTYGGVLQGRIYLMMDGDELVEYNYNELTKKWTKTAKKNDNLQDVIYTNVDKYIIRYEEENELEDGTICNVYKVTINDSNIFNASLSSFVEEIEKMGVSKNEIKDALKEVEYTYYIDKDKKLIRKVEFDLKDTLNSIINQDTSEKLEIFTVAIEYLNYNNISFKIPVDEIEKSIDN